MGNFLRRERHSVFRVAALTALILFVKVRGWVIDFWISIVLTFPSSIASSFFLQMLRRMKKAENLKDLAKNFRGEI